MKKIKTEVHEVSPKELADALCDSVNSVLNERFDKLEKNLQTKVPDRYMTRKEVADFFRIPLVATYKWDKQGILNPHRIGGNRVRYLRTEVEAIQQEKKI